MGCLRSACSAPAPRGVLPPAGPAASRRPLWRSVVEQRVEGVEVMTLAAQVAQTLESDGYPQQRAAVCIQTNAIMCLDATVQNQKMLDKPIIFLNLRSTNHHDRTSR